MKISITLGEGRVLYAAQHELKCGGCGKMDTDRWYFYTLDDTVYCQPCAKHGRGLPVDSFYQELIMVDKVIIEEDTHGE